MVSAISGGAGPDREINHAWRRSSVGTPHPRRSDQHDVRMGWCEVVARVKFVRGCMCQASLRLTCTVRGGLGIAACDVVAEKMGAGRVVICGRLTGLPFRPTSIESRCHSSA